MNRGEVWWVNFDPSIGGEIAKQRPAVIISNDVSNKYLNRLQVVPVTTAIDKLYPSEAYIIINKKQNKVMCDQIATASKIRLINKIGKITDSDMTKIENALKVQLGMD